MRTVRILGGGLSGLALGIALRARGVPAVVHEAMSYPRQKVCGEFLGGLDPEVADVLGLEEILQRTGAPSLRATTWFRVGRHIYECTLPAPAPGISRHSLDRTLAERFVAMGGDLVTGSRVDTAAAAEGDVLATGSPAHGTPRWVGLKLHVRGWPDGPDLEMHLGNGAYAGVSRIESGARNVCGLFNRDLVKGGGGMTGALRRAGLGRLADRVDAADVVDGSTASCVLPRFGRRPAEEHSTPALPLGDRHAMIPPFTGHGMAMALERGVVAAGPLESWATERASWTSTRRAFLAADRCRFGRRVAVACALHPVLLHPWGSSVLGILCAWRALPFDALYRLTHH